MNNKSYQQIFDQFVEFFPEFKQSVKTWGKCKFDSEMRIVAIALKNGCWIYFGTVKDGDDWVWNAHLDMSDKTKLKLGIDMDTDTEG